MIIKDEFLKKIRYIFDLNIYEAKIWMALLSRGISTAAELSDIGNVPRSRAYDILESLEKKGFVVMKLGKPIKYIAVKPEEVITRVKRAITQKSQERVTLLDEVKKTDVFEKINILHTKGIKFVEPNDVSGAIKGRDNIYNHLETMLKSAKESVVIVTSENGIIRKKEALNHIFKQLKAKKIKIRIAAPFTNSSKNIIKELSEFAEVRKLNDVNARFIIVDGNELLFMILNQNEDISTYDVGIWVKPPLFANALQNLFNLNWDNLPKAQ